MEPITQLELFKKAIDDLSEEGLSIYAFIRKARRICDECGMVSARDYGDVYSAYQPMPSGVLRKVCGLMLDDGYFYLIWSEYQPGADIVSLEQLN